MPPNYLLSEKLLVGSDICTDHQNEYGKEMSGRVIISRGLTIRAYGSHFTLS